MPKSQIFKMENMSFNAFCEKKISEISFTVHWLLSAVAQLVEH